MYMKNNLQTHNVNVNGSVNGGRKLQANSEETQRKHRAITSLSNCHYRTSPKQIAYFLTELFKNHESNEGHWLYIAQNYTPKTINSVINQMKAIHRRGDISIKNPSAYFTKLIKYHKKRKIFRATNGT